MKGRSIIVFLAVLGFTFSSTAQGMLNFANGSASGDYPVRLSNGALAQPSDGVLVDLYYGSIPSVVTNALGLQVQISTNGIFTGASPGNQNPLPVPGTAPGGTIFVKVVAWRFGSSFQTAFGDRASTAVYQVSNLGGGLIPPPNIPLGSGFLQFVLIPEPSTLALAVMGLSTLCLLRRCRWLVFPCAPHEASGVHSLGRR